MATTKQRPSTKRSPAQRTKSKPKPPKAVHIMPPPIVEVEVSTRCRHDCFSVALRFHPSRWNLPGAEPQDMDAEGLMIFHRHFEGEDWNGLCEPECFEQDVV